MQHDWHSLLGVEEGCEDSVAVRHMESAIGLYLRRTCSLKDVTDITKVSLERWCIHRTYLSPVFVHGIIAIVNCW